MAMFPEDSTWAVAAIPQYACTLWLPGTMPMFHGSRQSVFCTSSCCNAIQTAMTAGMTTHSAPLQSLAQQSHAECKTSINHCRVCQLYACPTAVKPPLAGKSIAVAKTLAMLHMRCTAVTQVAKEIEAAVQAAVSKQAKKQQAMAAQAAAATDSRQRTELEAAVKNEEHKAKQLQQVQEAFAALVAGEAYAGQQGSYVGHYGTKGFHKCHIHVKHGVAGQLC